MFPSNLNPRKNTRSRKTSYTFAALFVAAGLSPRLALANEFSLLGATDFAIPSSGDSTLGSSSSLGLGAGFLWERRLHKRYTLELGGIYFQRNWTYSGSKTNSESLDLIQVPVLIRANFFYDIFSLGLGGYYAHYLGSIQDTSTSGSTTTISNNSYASQQRTTSDYGLLASLKMVIDWSDDFPKFFVDARYSYGLADNSLTSTSLKFSDFQLLFGVTFGVMKK